MCADGGDDSVKVDEEEEVREYRVKCLNNLAAAQLKLEQYEEALRSSRDVLTLEQNNVKALFRTGKVRRDFDWGGGTQTVNMTREAHPEFCLKRIFSALLLTVDLLIFQLLSDRGEYKEAMEVLKKALKLEPTTKVRLCGASEAPPSLHLFQNYPSFSQTNTD